MSKKSQRKSISKVQGNEAKHNSREDGEVLNGSNQCGWALNFCWDQYNIYSWFIIAVDVYAKRTISSFFWNNWDSLICK